MLFLVRRARERQHKWKIENKQMKRIKTKRIEGGKKENANKRERSWTFLDLTMFIFTRANIQNNYKWSGKQRVQSERWMMPFELRIKHIPFVASPVINIDLDILIICSLRLWNRFAAIHSAAPRSLFCLSAPRAPHSSPAETADAWDDLVPTCIFTANQFSLLSLSSISTP